jgi:hypothetical protein
MDTGVWTLPGVRSGLDAFKPRLSYGSVPEVGLEMIYNKYQNDVMYEIVGDYGYLRRVKPEITEL